MKSAAWLIFFLIMAVSCLDQPDCFRQNLNLIGVSFKKMSDGKADTVSLSRIYDIPYDSTLPTTNISILVNYLDSLTSVLLKERNRNYLDQVNRTYSFKLGYKVKAQFVSEDCGAKFILSDLKLRQYNVSDSIRVASTSLTNPAHTNIEIYSCPQMDQMKISFRQLFIDGDSVGKPDVQVFNSIKIDGVEFLKSKPASLGAILLPLNPDATSVLYSFEYLDNNNKKQKDSISVGYQTYDSVIFKICGKTKVFTNLDTAYSTLKIIKIPNKVLHDRPTTNIVSFRCPTTNEIKMVFRKSKGSLIPVIDTLTSVTADFPIDLTVFADSAANSFTLPLNPDPNAASTTFTFVIKGQSKILQIAYVTTSVMLHKACGAQTVFTALQVLHNDFTDANILINDVRYPAVNNVEIVP